MIIYVNTVQYTNVRKCTVSNKKRNLFRKDYSESYRIKMDIVEKIVKNCLIYSSFGEGLKSDLRACHLPPGEVGGWASQDPGVINKNAAIYRKPPLPLLWFIYCDTILFSRPEFCHSLQYVCKCNTG